MTERPNKELALRYWNDPTLQAWWWDKDVCVWRTAPQPSFHSNLDWHVGHEAPTEPPVKMCELAGVKFPMPMREAPRSGTIYWPAHMSNQSATWDNDHTDNSRLEMNLCQATREGAIAQGRAMAAALRQAIEGAK